MTGKFIILPKRSLPILGNKVTLNEGNDIGVKSAEKSDYLVVARKRVKARGAKGMMKMRTTKLEQLNLVFADSPQGGQDAKAPDLLGGATSRLHKTKGKDFDRFVAGAADASSLLDAVASEFNLLRALYKVIQNKRSARRGPAERGSGEGPSRGTAAASASRTAGGKLSPWRHPAGLDTQAWGWRKRLRYSQCDRSVGATGGSASAGTDL